MREGRAAAVCSDPALAKAELRLLRRSCALGWSALDATRNYDEWRMVHAVGSWPLFIGTLQIMTTLLHLDDAEVDTVPYTLVSGGNLNGSS
jgi:hypothetical protein